LKTYIGVRNCRISNLSGAARLFMRTFARSPSVRAPHPTRPADEERLGWHNDAVSDPV
jgi:hypothetical protein